MNLWPAISLPKLPEEEKITERSKDPAKPDRGISFVSNPTITIYLPEKQSAPTPAVVICPGGGYHGLAIDKEGHDVARWLNSIGVAGIVLKYRLPRPELSEGQTPWPMQDAWRAIRIVRTNASQWNIDPTRVGIMGFSAGGHLAAMTGVHFDAGRPDAPDPIDRASSRPDFLILGYPVITFSGSVAHKGSRANLLGKTADPKLFDYYSAELQVTPQTPPAFVVQAKDDPIKVENAILFHDAMTHANIPCELQLYDKGRHGFGLGVHGGEVASWPSRCEEWLKHMGILK
jgi:acetyl esterase/lipase